MYTLNSECSKWPAFAVEITPKGWSAFASPITVFITGDRVDSDCVRISAQMPDAEVRICCMARFRATYVNGKRTSLTDMRTFYSNLSDEDYKKTQFSDSRTAELI